MHDRSQPPQGEDHPVSATPASKDDPGSSGSKEDPGNPAMPASNGRSVLLTTIKLAILGLAVLLVIRLAGTVGWAEIRQRLQSAARLPIAAAFICMLFRFVVWQERWHLSLRSIEMGEVSFLRRFGALTASFLVNHITPTVRLLGGIVRARFVTKPKSYTFAKVYGTVLFDQIIHHSVVGAATWLSFVAFTWALGRRGLSLGALGLVPLIVLIVMIRGRGEQRSPQRRIARSLTRRMRNRSQRFDLFLDRGRDTVRTLTGLLKTPRLLTLAIILSAVAFALFVTSQTLLFSAVGTEIEMWKVAVIVALGGIAGALTGTPGGVGSTEAAMIAGFAALGVERVDAITAALLFRGLHYLAVISCGLPSLIWLELDRRGARRAEPT